MARAPVAIQFLLVVLGTAGAASANTLFVAQAGADGPACGAQDRPCRSISRAITNASDGDMIVVGPGFYGDIDGDGVLSATSGDEMPGAVGLIAVAKSLAIVSSAGADSTVIYHDSPTVPFGVDLEAAGVRFGAVGGGFTVRGNGANCSAAIRGVGANSTIEGNVLTGCFRGADLSGAAVVLSQNEARGNVESGFVTRSAGAIVRGNRAISNGFTGFVTEGDSWQMTGNASISNSGDGATVDGNGTFNGNAMIGNAKTGLGVNGFLVAGHVNLTITANSFYGNRALGGNCGIFNNTFTVLNAPGNFWGLATGPGADPADQLCGNPIVVNTWLTAPTAAADVYGGLVQGISRVGGVGFPSAITGWSEDWQVIVTGDNDNGPLPTHYVMARSYENGRVTAFGHESLLTPEGVAAFDNGRLVSNVVTWLDQRTSRKVLYTTGHDEGIGTANLTGLRSLLPQYSFTPISAPITSTQLPTDAVLIIGHAKADFTLAEIEVIRRFVAAGGGLLLAAQGWAWIPYWNRPLDEFPMNRVGEPFAIRWLGANLRDPTDETAAEEAIYHTLYPEPRTTKQFGIIDSFMSFAAENFVATRDTDGCSAGFAGTLLVDTRARLDAGGHPLSGLAVRVLQLSGGNALRGVAQPHGGTGAEFGVPFETYYEDGILTAVGETASVPIAVCLKTMKPFRFVVDLMGRDESNP